jgi:hypothetical protein
MASARAELRDAGKAHFVTEATGGRSAERWYAGAVPSPRTHEAEAKIADLEIADILAPPTPMTFLRFLRLYS